MFSTREGRHVVDPAHRRLRRAQHDRPTTTAIRALQKLQATVYVIGIGGVAGISLKGETLLRQHRHADRRPGVLPDARGRAAQRPRDRRGRRFRRYVLTYTPTNQEVDGTFRAIRLAASRPALTDPDPRGLLRAEAAAGQADASSSAPPTPVAAAARAVAPTTWSSSRTAWCRRSSRSRRRSRRSRSRWCSTPAAACGGRWTRPSRRRGRSSRRCGRPIRWRWSASPTRSCSSTSCPTRRQTTLEAIDRLEANGGTALFDALLRLDGVPQAAPGPPRHRAALGRPRREQPRHRARQRAHGGRRAGAGARDRHHRLRDRARRQRRPAGARAAGRALGRRGDVSRPTPASSTASSAACSTSCGAATSSATPRPTRSATAAGGRWWSAPASRGSRIRSSGGYFAPIAAKPSLQNDR